MPKIYNRKAWRAWEEEETISDSDSMRISDLKYFAVYHLVSRKTSRTPSPRSAHSLFREWVDMRIKAHSLSKTEVTYKVGERTPNILSDALWEEPNLEVLFQKWVELINKVRGSQHRGLQVKPRATFAIRLSEAQTSELNLGRNVLHEFEHYARRIIGTHNVRLVSVNIIDWVSVDDPSYKQLIIDLLVETEPDLALELWDNLSDELRTFIETRYEKEASELHDLLSVTVRW